MTKPHIAVIIGSTRPTRFADKPAAWLMEHAKARTDMTFELVDLRDFDLPFFMAPASDLWMPATDERVIRWQKKMASFDGYIFVLAEYNHSINGALKNAFDQAYTPWARKPVGALAYGSMGGARALEHLRNIAVELQTVPLRNAVHIGGGDFFKVSPLGANADMREIDATIRPSLNAMLDEMAWWGSVLKKARAEG